jgi:hypothetical protein
MSMFIIYPLGEDVTTRNEAMGAHTPWNLSGGPGMSHVFQIPDDLYEKLATYAAQQKLSESPLFQIAGIFAIGDPGWADKHDEYLSA